MKKLLGTALCAAILFAGRPAIAAEFFKNLKVNGGLDLQMISGRNLADFSTAGAGFNDRRGGALTRTWAALNWDLLDDIHAKVSLVKNDRPWGTNGGVGAGGAGGQSAATGFSQRVVGSGAGVNDVASNIWVQEAYVKIDKAFGVVDATLGRQYYGNPGDLIIYYGPKNTYGLFITAIDAFRADYSNDWVNASGLAGKTTGSGLAAALGDVDVRGLDVGVKNLPVKANVFLWNQQTHATGSLGVAPIANNPAAAPQPTTPGLNDQLWVYGFKVRGEAMGGWLGLTGALNGGTNRSQAVVPVGTNNCGAFGCNATSANYDGKGLLIDAGYKADVANVGGFTPWFTWGWGSGRQSQLENKNADFTTIASDFRPGVIYGRFSGALAAGAAATSAQALGGALTTTGFEGQPLSQPGLNNRIIWGGGLKVNPSMLSKMTAGVSYWDFNFQTATPGGAGTWDPVNGVSRPGPAAMGNRHIGSEIDIQFDWTHSDNVSYDAGWATFQPGGFVNEVIRADATRPVAHGNNPATLIFADLNVKF